MSARDDLIAAGVDHFTADAIISKARREAVNYTRQALARVMPPVLMAVADNQLSHLLDEVEIWNEELIND